MNAIVTAASKGIGRAISILLAENGYNVAICARNEQDLVALAKQLSYTGKRIVYFKADLSNKAEAYAFCDFAIREFGDIDVLVNNAGIFVPSAILEEEDADFDLQLNLNLSAAYYISKRMGKAMRDRRSGHIFNICSAASREIIKNAGTYSVTKTAMLCLNSVLRQELAEFNVKVTAILPGATLTASWDGTDIPAEKFIKPEDIAKALFQVLMLGAAANVDEVLIKPIHF
jgi:3-oxoacyl-[acyl-carrier protein] reductase